VRTRSTAAFFGLGATLAYLSIAAPAHAVTMAELQMGEYAIQNGVFNAVFAKEVCSCIFVDGLTLQDCTDPIRDNLPPVATSLVNISVDPVNQTVSSSYKGADEINAALASLSVTVASVGGPASAKYDPNLYGCVLTLLPVAAAPPASAGDAGADAGIVSGDAGMDAGMDAGVDAGLDAGAPGATDAAPPAVTAPAAPDCGPLADGQYCGDDGIENGDASTLYACSAGSLSTVQVCASGCEDNFGMDACN